MPMAGRDPLDEALIIRDKVIMFEAADLHYNDGDRHNSREVAVPLREARDRLSRYIEHLESVPFQPDR